MVPLVDPALSRLQIAGCARRLWRLVITAAHLCRENEMTAQMRDMLEKQGFVSQCDVVEEHEMLMQLSHVTYVRRQWKTKLSRKETDRKKLTHASQPCAVGLDIVQSVSLHEVL